MTTDLEIIDFYRPTEDVKNLFVTNLSADLNEEALHAKLHSIFTGYGLLYEIQVFKGTPDIGSERQVTEENPCAVPLKPSYAFIKFFSKFAAAKAKADLSGRIVIKGQLARIKYANRKNVQATPQPVFITKCYELANHYLGFNGWQVSIISIKADEDSSQGIIRCVARVKLEIVKYQLYSEGLHVSEQKWPPSNPCEKGEVLCRLKKTTFQRASENAFSKVLIVVLASGKIHVEINTTYEETLDDIAEMRHEQFIKVNELDEAPESDEEAEESAAADLDELNRHLLLDLAEEWQ